MSTETQQAIEIGGTPTSIPQQNLEEKVCQIFKAINVSVDKSDTDDCHRLRDKEWTIVKFLRRKDCKQVLRCKKDLQSINMSILIFQREPNCSLMKVYVLTMKGLWVIRKKMWNRKRIHSFFTANGTIKFRFEEHGPGNVVTHQQDLEDLVDIDAL